MANDRIYQNDDGEWFFRVRGNHDVGPFPTEAQAVEKLEKHVAQWWAAPRRRSHGPALGTPRASFAVQLRVSLNPLY